jgi:hypothetical protein
MVGRRERGIDDQRSKDRVSDGIGRLLGERAPLGRRGDAGVFDDQLPGVGRERHAEQRRDERLWSYSHCQTMTM